MAQKTRSSAIGYVVSLAIVVLTSVSARIYMQAASLQIAEASSVSHLEVMCK